MTPKQFNEVIATMHEKLVEDALPKMAARYERILRSQGRIMARRFSGQALVAAFVPPDEDVVIDSDRLTEKITKQTEKERRAAAEAIRDALAVHDIVWDIHGNFTPDLLASVGSRATFAAEQELRDIYRGVITQAAEEGWSIPRTSSAIVSNVDGVAAYRATALARTDLIGLANGASQDAAVDAFAEREDVTKIWLATADDRTRDTHIEADGQEVPLNQPFDVGGAPLMYPGDPDGPDEEVINCVLGTARVTLPGLVVATRRRYEGEVVTLHTRGHRVTVTPNHPVLTAGYGWRAAQEIRKGDRLGYATLREGMGNGDPEIDDVQPTAAEIFDARSLSERVGGLDMDFHGDGRADEDVEVVRAEGSLWPRMKSSLAQGVHQAALVRADLAAGSFASESLGEGFGFLGADATPGLVSRLSTSASRLGCHLRGADAVRLGAAARLYPGREQPAPDGGAADSEGLSEDVLALASDIAFDEVVNVERHPYTGHVYNFDAGQGWYIADGILHRNCRCTLVYGSAEAEAAAAEEGLPAEGEASFAHTVPSGVYSLTMPWHVVSKHKECTEGKPFAVVKDDDGSVAGCHETREAANRQMRALYAKEGDMSSVTVTVNGDEVESTVEYQRTPWEGILAIEGHPTSDGRYLIPGEIDYRELPLPIAASHESQHETKTVGRIESITNIPVSEFDREDWNLPEMAPHAAIIWGEGTFDGSPDAEDALRQLENGVGISLDLPTERQAIINAETYEEVDPSTLGEEDMLAIALGMLPDGYLRGFAGKIGGASLASIAAFEETRIRIIDNVALVASGFAIRERDLVIYDGPDAVGFVAGMAPMVASAAPIAPPRDWFFVEEPDEPTPLTILPNGQIYGHLALWNTCHVGRMNGAFSSCMYAPHSATGYSQFHLGAMLCEDGTEIPVGRLTIGTGHAPLHLGAAAARAHYDHTGTVVGFVRAKDGVFGIWLCGVQKSDATEEQVRDLRACPPSGDWRNHDHALELQAALAVNTAGFPVPRSQLALAASGEALEVATLILGAPDEDDFVESLKAEYALTDEENVAILFDLDDEPLPAA